MATQLMLHRSLFIWSDLFGGEEGIAIRQPLTESPTADYLVVSILSVGGLSAAAWLRNTNLGRQLRASGGDTRVGLASGVRVPWVRVAGSALSGLLAGAAASVYVMHTRVANHELASDSLAGLIFLLAAVGGVGTVIGPWLAALLYVAVIRELLIPLGGAEPVVVFGVLMLLIWVAPQGIVRTLVAARPGALVSKHASVTR